MEGAAVLSTQGNGRFRSHLKSAANALCRAGAGAAAAVGGGARTLPKQRVSVKQLAAHHHHTFPKMAAAAAAGQRPSSLYRHLGGLFRPPSAAGETAASPPRTPPAADDEPAALPAALLVDGLDLANGLHKLKGKMAREVASAWSCRVGAPDQPAPAVHVQSLFNDLHLYPTKTQVFEMLVCARQCARRKSLSLTFGEFCVFAAELRKCSRRSRQSSSKPDATCRAEPPLQPVLNGSEASPPPAPLPPPCEVFLGGSCNPTTWRSEIAIPILEQMGITYFNPQVAEWSLELVEVESRAKQAARALLFVLDSETRAVAAAVEAAQLAALPRDLLLVLRPYRRGQRIGNEIITDQEYVELSRARATLQEAVERRGLPVFTDIPSALRCARTVLRGARTHPRQPLGQTILRLKRAFDAAGARAGRLGRARALHALAELARAPRAAAARCLPATDPLDFEAFCAAVAELTAEYEGGVANGEAGSAPGSPAEAECRCPAEYPAGAAVSAPAVPTASNVTPAAHHNSRLKACGKKLSIFIPKSGSAEDSVLTPGTERRLERLPAMLDASPPPPVTCPAAHAPSSPPPYLYDVYLGGSIPQSGARLEERLRAAGLTYVVPRLNDYTRMFSRPARRTADAHPDSPTADKKPRPSPATAATAAAAAPTSPHPRDVELRERAAAVDPGDRLSASDFYTVSDDHTPLPFKGTYDEEPLWGSRALLFCISSQAPCFASMVLAAHYMELRPAATVLLVQNMPDDVPNLSENAVKDYNRGRHYLTDLARRSGLPIFYNTEEALACVLAKVAGTHRNSSAV